IPERRVGIVGVEKKAMEPDAIERVLAERRKRWAAPPFRHKRGILSLYSRVATGSSQGALMTPHDGTDPDAVPAGAQPVTIVETLAPYVTLAGKGHAQSLGRNK